jgi:hypothetical protein
MIHAMRAAAVATAVLFGLLGYGSAALAQERPAKGADGSVALIKCTREAVSAHWGNWRALQNALRRCVTGQGGTGGDGTGGGTGGGGDGTGGGPMTVEGYRVYADPASPAPGEIYYVIVDPAAPIPAGERRVITLLCAPGDEYVQPGGSSSSSGVFLVGDVEPVTVGSRHGGRGTWENRDSADGSVAPAVICRNTVT